MKFTKEGQIELRVDATKEKDGCYRLVIEVEDTGIGINEEEQMRVFQSFVQVESKETQNIGGTGLGLSIALQLVHLMKGKIELESRYGEGALFRVILSGIELPVGKKEEQTELPLDQELSPVQFPEKIQLSREKMRDFLVEMNAQILPLWKKVNDTNSMQDIEVFSQKIIELGNHYQLLFFIDYGKRLETFVGSFDVENTKKTLADFLDLQNKICASYNIS